LASLFPDFSRSKLQGWIKDGNALLDGRSVSNRHKVFGGEQVALHALLEMDNTCEAQDLPLEIVHEDDDVLIVNKPSGLVAHPAAGHSDGTLQNALLFHLPSLAALPRAGLVHRIDKDTTGLLMVAKTLKAHKSLVEQLQERSIHREYLALVHGFITGGGTLDDPIGRHPSDRKRFAVRPDGKPSITHYRIERRFQAHTLLRVKLETGRTHQIRVHLAHIHHPLVGDPVYGGRMRVPAGASPRVIDALQGFRRQALHAEALGLQHPSTGEWLEWQATVPADMAALLEILNDAA